MDTITVTNHADIEFLVLVNEKFWQGLPEKHRELIAAAGRKAEIAVRDELRRRLRRENRKIEALIARGRHRLADPD